MELNDELNNAAQAMRYDRWAGNPAGHAVDAKRCVDTVKDGAHCFVQCSRKRGKGPAGLYCGVHANAIKRNASDIGISEAELALRRLS